MYKKQARCGACRAERAPQHNFCHVCGAPAKDKVTSSENGFQVTIVREKNVKQRNLLLLGAVVCLTTLAAAGTVYSIFNKALDVAAIETNDPFAFVAAIDPDSLDPAEELEKNKKKQGGGGGGRHDRNPAQRGAEATQVDDPQFSPSKDYVRLTDPEIKIRAATEGTKKTPVTNEPYGLVRGGEIPSDGRGCCGGQGESPLGRGQGENPGDGIGPGINGGYRGGSEGREGGKPDEKEDVPKVKTGGGNITRAVNIIAKPRANYTDAAREKLVQGKVVLRVTFLASGAIGQISVVQGLTGGLTENAIAAARAIRFEPARVNGVAVSVTKTIEYNFSIF
jgi:TonB family protein